MALNITINKTAVAASYPAGSTVATAVASGGTTPYTYSLATGGDYFNIDASTGVVTTKALMDVSSIQSFSVTATDSNSTPESITSGVVYPNIQAAIQNKFSKSNMIYKITKDIDLGNCILTIPSGCTLDFQGGSFSNGTIIGNNTSIKANSEKIFNNIQFNKGFLYAYASADWFNSLNSAIDFININSGILQLSNKKYTIDSTLELKDEVCIQGVGTEAWGTKNKGTYIEYTGTGAIISVSGDYSNNTSIKNISIKDLKLVGNVNCTGISLTNGVHYVNIENVTIHNCNKGMYFNIVWHLNVTLVACYSCDIAVHADSSIGMTSSIFSSCLCYNSRVGFLIESPMIYSSFIACGTDGCNNSLIINAATRGLVFVNFGFEKSTESGITLNNPNLVATFLSLTLGAGSAGYNIDYIKINSCYAVSILDTFIPSGFASTSGFSINIANGFADKVTLINCEFNGLTSGTEGCTILKGKKSVIPNNTDIIVTNAMQSSTIPVYRSGSVILRTDNNERELKGTPIFNISTLPVGSVVTVINGDPEKQFNIRTETYLPNTGIIGVATATLELKPYEGAIFIKNVDGKLLFRNSIKPIAIGKGSTPNRPILSSSDVGYQYYDTTLLKYICWNGTAWVNLDGTPLA